MKSPMRVLLSMLVTLLASACASAQPITEPVAVIEAFYEALNDVDLDTAMGFVADDASLIINCYSCLACKRGEEPNFFVGKLVLLLRVKRKDPQDFLFGNQWDSQIRN